MIYLNHDFYSNFSAGSNADGNNLTIDLFSNELSDLIFYETPQLIETLGKVDVKVNENMSDEEIVDNVILGISKNDKVVKAIGFAIAESNGLINSNKGGEVDWIKTINTIVLGLTPASEEITKSEESKSIAKQKIMQQIETKAKMKGNYKRKIWKSESKSGSNTLAWIAGAVIVGVIGYLIYRGMKPTFVATSTTPIIPPTNG